ncbi:MAG: adenylosuccinate synthetase [Chloroflexi bacterium]|nr:adenylosuccinate synthetase [Chloroflexota bacterium]
MERKIILLSGPVASGKSELADLLAGQFDLLRVETSKLLRARLGEAQSGRVNLQIEGDELDKATHGRWVLDEFARELRQWEEGRSVIVDSVRIPEQVSAIREAYGAIVSHVHLTAPVDVLTDRYNSRRRPDDVSDRLSYDDIRLNDTERLVGRLEETADIVIDSARCNSKDVLVRVASHLRLYGEQDAGFVDVIVGGQYGSEGKGQIAGHLAREYDLLVRVGGPNAGHKVFELPEPYTHHQLPSGSRKNQDAQLLIGPGAVLNVEKLLQEIAECGVEYNRLGIDRRAMVIQDVDIEDETTLVGQIGSTGQGVGAATSRRIMKRNITTELAKDIPELAPYMCDALDVLNSTLAANGRICLEGTQGTALSLFHGDYPYVTSRDTTVSGCIAEAGIPPGKIRRVVMVCRTYPIRVQNPDDGTSGPMSQEISLAVIANRSGKSLQELEKTEITSTTRRERRIAEFDWDLLRKASLLNGPTDIALTFTDYLSSRNGEARRFEQLQSDTIQFIQEVERVSGAHVSLISTGFNFRSIIDRRSW